jgi:hypothetical protein
MDTDNNTNTIICHDCKDEWEEEDIIYIKTLDRYVCCECIHDYEEFLEGNR